MKEENYFLVTIIGAGPSGLCCAYELVKNKIGPILIIEKGPNIGERNHKIFTSHYISGVGGPGLYGDAKLCVYGKAGAKLINFFNEKNLDQLANYVDKIFSKFDEKYTKKKAPSKLKLNKLLKICKSAGFELKMAYPVRHLGPKRGKIVIQNFITWLKENKVSLYTNTEVVKVLKTLSGDYKIIVKRKKSGKEIIKCKYLIAAVGRGGNQWLKKQCERLKIPFSLNVPDIGVRIECPSNVLKPLHSLVKNPRIELKIKNTYIKTHCLCLGGEIIIYHVKNLPLIDGYADRKGNNAHINLLYHSKENKKIINSLTKLKKPLIQRMEDFMINKISKKEEILKNKLIPSAPLESFTFNNINKIYPPYLISALKKFINKFNKLCPGFDNSHNLIYAPVVEWDTYQIKVNKEMETKQRNFYVIGDGSGLTQGIIAAGVTGIIAARSITNKEKKTLAEPMSLE